MCKVAQRMLDAALKSLDGVSWRVSDVPKLADTASKLARLAAQMELGSIKMSVEQLDEELGKALEEYYMVMKRSGKEDDVIDAEFAALTEPNTDAEGATPGATEEED